MSTLASNGHRKVRVLVRENSEASSEFFNMVAAANGKSEWKLGEWQALLAQLDACELTVDEYRLTN